MSADCDICGNDEERLTEVKVRPKRHPLASGACSDEGKVVVSCLCPSCASAVLSRSVVA